VRDFFPSFLPSSLREKMGTVGWLLVRRRVAAARI
jgi:hypothetical protein